MGCFKNPVTTFILKILFSHVGLCFLVCGYIVGGAYLFQWIEGDGEKERYMELTEWAVNISTDRELLIERVTEYCRYTDKDSNESINDIYAMLQNYHNHIGRARNRTQSWRWLSYHGVDEPHPNFGWEITSAILFTATIMTTIGYGHIAPVTETGYLVCVIYSVFAIPLLSMFVLNITGVLSTAIRLLYHRGICFAMERRRDLEHAAVRLDDGTPDEDGSYYQKRDVNFSHDTRVNAWAASAERQDDQRRQSELIRYRPENLVPASLAVIFWVLYFMAGAVLFQRMENDWTMITSFYFVAVTLMTIGFGDVIPGLKSSGTKKGQIEFGIVSIYVVVGLAMTGSVTRLGFDAAKEHMGRGKRLLAEKAEALREAARKKLNPDDLYDKDDKIDHVSMTPFTTH